MKNNRYIKAALFLWALVPIYFFTVNTFTKGGYVAVTFVQSLLALFVLNFSAYFLGTWFFRLTGINIGKYHISRLYKLATGYGVIFITLLFSGMLGLFTDTALTVCLALLACFSAFGAYDYFTNRLTGGVEENSTAQTVMFSSIAFVLTMGFLMALAPPTSRDAIIHHLAVPKLYLRAGGIVPLDFMPFSFRSINLELLYTLALFVKNDIIARVIHFNFYVLSVIATYYFIRGAFSKNAALVGALIFASIPVAFNTATRAYVDFGLVFFGILLLNCARQFNKTGDNAYLILGGIMSGLCASTKINGYLLVALVFVWIVSITQRKKYDLKMFAKAIGIFLLFAFAFDVHLLTKNTVETKNPLYPILSPAFEAGGYDAGGSGGRKLLPIEVRKLLHGQTWLDEALMPWAVSTKVQSRVPYTVDGVLGPIFIIFIPFIVFLKDKRYELFSMLAIAAVYVTVCWGVWGVRLRYFLPLFPIGAFMIAAVIDELFDWRGEARIRANLKNVLLITMLSVTFALSAYHILAYVSIKAPFEFLSGKVNKERYIARHYYQHEMFKFINENITDKNALIYFLDFGQDGYYSDVAYYYDKVFLGERFFSIVKSAKVPSDIRDRLKESGITHLLVNLDMFRQDIDNNYDAAQRRITLKFVEEQLRPLKMIKSDAIYEIR